MVIRLINSLKTSRDILYFQILNWGGSLALYYVILFLYDSDTATKIAIAEVQVSWLGTFFATLSLSMQNEVPTKTDEHKIIALKIIIILLSIIFINNVNYEFILLALMASIIPPTHLPIRLGFNLFVYYAISVKFLIFIFLIIFKEEVVLSNNLQLYYFSANIIFGILLYFFYYERLENISKNNRYIFNLETILRLIFCWVAAIFQSRIISILISEGAIFAFSERVIRSLQSFVSPYFHRKALWNKKVVQYTVLFLVLTAVFLMNYLPVKMFVPALLDAYINSIFGKIKIFDFLLFLIMLKT